MSVEVGAFGEVLAEETVGVLVGAAARHSAGRRSSVRLASVRIEHAEPFRLLGPRSTTSGAGGRVMIDAAMASSYGLGAMTERARCGPAVA